MTRLLLLSCALVLVGPGCGGGTTSTDAGTDAADVHDGGSDAGTVNDAGSDTGTANDAGSDTGGSLADAGSDTGSTTDANTDAGGPAAGCTASGGTVGTQLCCGATGDFPNTCLTGACGCSPSSSHDVMACQCPGGTCFDGSRCVSP